MPAVTMFTEHNLDAADIRGELNTANPKPFGMLHLGRGNRIHVRSADDARRMVEALNEIAIGLDFHARAVEFRVPATAAPAVTPPPAAQLAEFAEVITGAQPAPPFCTAQHADGFLCVLPMGHDGDHANSTGGFTWPRLGATAPLAPQCPATIPSRPGGRGKWQCTLDCGHAGRHEAQGASPLPVWHDGDTEAQR